MLNKAILLTSGAVGPICTLTFMLCEEPQGSGTVRGLLNYERDLISSSIGDEIKITGFYDCINTSLFGDSGEPGFYGVSVTHVTRAVNENTGVTFYLNCLPFVEGTYIFTANNKYLFDGVETGETCSVTFY